MVYITHSKPLGIFMLFKRCVIFAFINFYQWMLLFGFWPPSKNILLEGLIRSVEMKFTLLWVNLYFQGVYVLRDECIFMFSVYLCWCWHCVCVCVSAEPQSAGDAAWHPEDPAAAHLCSSVRHLRLSEHRLRDHHPHRAGGSAADATAGVCDRRIWSRSVCLRSVSVCAERRAVRSHLRCIVVKFSSAGREVVLNYKITSV